MKKPEVSDKQADEAWKQVVEAFHKNDMAKASELGQAFLVGNLKPSAYQLLGVKVMLGLAADTPEETVFGSHEDQQKKKKLEEERTNITRRYQELTNIYRDADARINQLTLNRTRPVQQGSSNHLECMRCLNIMEETKAELDKMNKPIEANKKAMAALTNKAEASLKPQTLELLDMLLEAHEVEAAFAIANTYIRKVGNDFDVAKKQQEVVRVQEISEKATKVLTLLQAEIDGPLQKKRYWEAQAKASQFSAKVAQLNNEADFLKMVRGKIQVVMLPVTAKIEEAGKANALIKEHASEDFADAHQKFEKFVTEYPDSPECLELELFIATAKTKSVDKILARMTQDFDELQKRFDPEKLRAFVSRTSVDYQKESAILTSRENVHLQGGAALADLGVAPADARLVQSKLEGISAALSMIEKLGAPPDRLVRVTEIKTTVSALSSLIKQG